MYDLRRKKRYMSVGDAAEYLGIERELLIAWSDVGKILVRRNPVNGHRLYDKEYLKKNFNEIAIFSSVEGNEGE